MNRPIGRFAHAIVLPLVLVAAGAEASGRLELVSVRDHIEGSFVTNRAVHADAERIYLASFQGELFVVARDRASDFPLLERIRVSSAPVVGVVGDRKRIYAVDQNGTVYVYRKTHPLLLSQAARLTTFVSSLALKDGYLYVSTGGHLAVDIDHVYLSAPEISENHVVYEFDKVTLAPGRTYDASSASNATAVFNRHTGDMIATLPNPVNLSGSRSLANLYVDGRMLAQTTPGCCGAGVAIYDPESLEFEQFVDRRFVNSVEHWGRWLVTGTEAGEVDLFNLARGPAVLVSTVNLPRETSHTQPEDIEIRALWMDRVDNLIFAASSWGNDQSRSPFLPSFFVLELLRD